MTVTHDKILALLVLKDEEIYALRAELAAARNAATVHAAEADNLRRLVEAETDTELLERVG